jgi:hypothetical protein
VGAEFETNPDGCGHDIIKVTTQHSRGGTTEYHERSEENLCLSEDSKLEPPKYNSQSLPPQPACSESVTCKTNFNFKRVQY